jgi:hypothetical protein
VRKTAGVAQSVYCLTTGWPGFDPRQRQRVFPLLSASRPALGPTQPPVQWVPGVKHGRGVLLTTHPLLVLRLRKSRSYTSCHPNAPLWTLTGPLYLYLIMRNSSEKNTSLHLFAPCIAILSVLQTLNTLYQGQLERKNARWIFFYSAKFTENGTFSLSHTHTHTADKCVSTRALTVLPQHDAHTA